MPRARRRSLAGFAVALLSALCATADVGASGGSTPASGRCQQCDWVWVYCESRNDYYETCRCANVFDGNKMCRCVANRRDCSAWCEEGGGACSGETAGRGLRDTSDATWAWADREGQIPRRCLDARPDRFAGSRGSGLR
jgi:hypothetical protein